MIEWGAPTLLPMGLTWPLLGLFMWIGLRRRRARLEKLISRDLHPVLLRHLCYRRLYIQKGLRLLALGLLLVAAARPQWGSSWEEVEARSLDIIVALDTSKSMLAADLKPSRLQQAKWGIRDLITSLNSDRIGLIAFSGRAFLQCPPTLDYAAFDMMLEDLYAGIIPVGGTALSEALRCALESFDIEATAHADRVLILISDGESHTGDVEAYLTSIKEAGIRIFSIGVGTRSGELIYTDKGFVKNREGEVVKSRLQESPLEELARETGGFYLRATPGDMGLERIYTEGIAPLQRQLESEDLQEIRTERFPLFLAMALLLLLVERWLCASTAESAS